MKKLIGALTLIATIFLVAPPPGAYAQKRGEDTSTYSSRKVSRDLGPKGQIVIESLELNEADIGDVVRLLARLAGINIITGDIRGSITVYLENVTVQDAMEAILASQGYGFLFDGNIVRVVEASRLGEDRVETITETFLLNYLPAEEVANTLKNVFKGGDSLGGSYSQIEANVEANAVIVVDIPRKMEDIRRLIYILDRRFEQVEIEGRFIEISYSQDQEWGIDWKYFQDPANTFDVNLAPQPLDAQNVAGQFKFAVINGNNNLQGFIQALETDNDVRVLANPKILALENQPALIELTDELPFVEANISQGVITESVQFQETGIRLQVTPSIAHESDGTFVRMTLDLEQRIPGPNVVLQNSTAFPVDSRHAQTDLIVPDEATVVIGGLRSNDLTYTYEKIPFLGSIPFLGAPFRRRDKTEDQTELILFVTPRVIYENPPLDMKEQELHDKIEDVIDSLETQAEWRETVEKPIDMVDKAIQYSGVECNDERYRRVGENLDRIEGVKPYKIHKPKGIRKVRVDSTGEYTVEQEYVDKDHQPGEPPEVEVMKGEARDFSIIEKEAGPGSGDSGVKFYGEGEDGGEGGGSTYQEPPLPPPLPPTEQGGVQEQAPQSDDGRGSPSWLRKGFRSDAGEVEESNPTTIEELPSEEEVVDIEIAPDTFEQVSEGGAYENDSLETPPLDVQEEKVSGDLDPWGLPAEYSLEIPREEPVDSSKAEPALPLEDKSKPTVAEVVQNEQVPPRVEKTEPAVVQSPKAEPALPREMKSKPMTVEAPRPKPVPEPPVKTAQEIHKAPISETPQKVEEDGPVEVDEGKADLLALPNENPKMGKAEPVKKAEPAKPAASPKPAAPTPSVESKIAGAPLPPARDMKSEVKSAPVKPTAPAEVVNLTGLRPSAEARPIEKKPEPAVEKQTEPASSHKVAVAAPKPQPAKVSVVDLRGQELKADPDPDLRSMLDPALLEKLKQVESSETGALPKEEATVSTPQGPAVLDPWSPMPKAKPGATLSGISTPKVDVPTTAQQEENVPLIAHNETDKQPAASSENQSNQRSWWKKLLGKQ
ncbi:MAG: hypothetical protein H6752_14965 [Candidatus Omnitrophica bacterium]|nr:hypothetical protein [Candidatus Omnitrophota bacterium]